MSINYNSGLNLSGFGGTGGGSNPFTFGVGSSGFGQPAQGYSSYAAPAQQSATPSTGLPNYQAIQNQVQGLYAGMPNYNQNVQTEFKAMSPTSQNSSVQQGAQPSSQPNQAHQIISSLQQQPTVPQYQQQVQRGEEQSVVQALNQGQTPNLFTYAPGELSNKAQANPLQSLADQQYSTYMQGMGATALPGGGYSGTGGVPGQNIPAMNRMNQEVNAISNPDLFNYLYNAPISMFE